MSDLNFDDADELDLAGRAGLKVDGPAGAPTRVPEVGRLKLVRLDAGDQRHAIIAAGRRAEHGRCDVFVVHAHVLRQLALKRRSPRLRGLAVHVRVRFEFARFQVQMIESYPHTHKQTY